VEQSHAEARWAFKAWDETGRPKCGHVFQYMKKPNANFKNALRFIKSNKNTLKADLLARKLQSKSPTDFLKEINRMNSN